MKRIIRVAAASAVWLGAHATAFAQLGGTSGYSFLAIPPSARAAALGGLLPQNGKEDAASFLYNPASQANAGEAAVSYNPFAGRFRYTTAAVSADVLDGTAGVALQYLDYGTMNGYTPGGDPTGTFTANAYAVSLNYSRALGPFRYGANLKLAGSSIESYSSYGMGLDMGLSYRHPKEDFVAGIVLQNIGTTFKPFQGTTTRNWPFQIQAGVSYKFPHMPVRFYASGQQLQSWDIVYLDPSYSVKIDASGNEVPETKPWTEKLFRHTAIGAELLLGKSLCVRGGYNHLARKEMRIVDQSSSAGYSLGFGLNIKQLRFDYTHMFISQAGGANYINLSYAFGKKAEAVAPPAQ